MKTKIAIIGGFLGAGKTTLATKLAIEFKKKGKSVAIITNDQGEVLVDTQFVESKGIDVAEVLRGCFCCNFNDFVRNARMLATASRPEIILAEPVGSCTDLLATVVLPLKALYPKEFEVAPLTVLVDSSSVSDDLMNSYSPGDYLRRHQIMEAETLVLSKVDLVSDSEIPKLVDLVRKINKDANIVPYSAVNGMGFESIVKRIESAEVSGRCPVDIDYDVYATAEAQLGWYNGSFSFVLDGKIDTYGLAVDVLKAISQHYRSEDIAHVKLLLKTQSNALKVSLVQGNIVVDGIKGSRYGSGESSLVLNARVISAPEILKDVIRKSVNSSLERIEAKVMNVKDDSFSPMRPNPQYRLS